MSNEKNRWLVGLYRGSQTTQVYREYFKNHEIRSPILQFASHCLVGGFNPYEKYESKREASPNFGVKIKDV